MPSFSLFYRFGIALAIGLVVGLQREYDDTQHDEDYDLESFAGVRTFALMGLLGCLVGFLSDIYQAPYLVLGLLFPAALLIIVSYYLSGVRGSLGMTSEMAAFVTLLAGVICYWGQIQLAVAIGVATTVLLSLKLEIRRFVKLITREDVLATLKFAVITAIVLPLLPNEAIVTTPPFDVLNPYKIWLMVVLISAINFLGYILIKVMGSQRGVSLTGFLGGLVSSTAVTLSMTKSSQTHPTMGKSFALAIVIAWMVMFGRVIAEVGLVNMTLLSILWLPMAATMLVALAYCGYLYLGHRPQEQQEQVAVSNPFELGPAIKFGLLYGVILLVVRFAQLFLGTAGIYLSSVISGIADVDAITLSMAELSRTGSVELSTAAQAIVLATMSNTLVKGGVVLASGSQTLRVAIAPVLVLMVLTALGLSFLVL